MFVPCIIIRSRNNQHYALLCTTSLFYILASTCFGSSLSSSGSFLDPSELLEIQIESVVYHIMCGYVHMHSAGKHNRRNHDNPAHRPRSAYCWLLLLRLIIHGTNINTLTPEQLI